MVMLNKIGLLSECASLEAPPEKYLDRNRAIVAQLNFLLDLPKWSTKVGNNKKECMEPMKDVKAYGFRNKTGNPKTCMRFPESCDFAAQEVDGV